MLILPPFLHHSRNRIEVGLHRAIDLGKYRAEFGEYGCILGPRRFSKRVAGRGEELDAFLDASKEIADPQRHVQLPIADGEAEHEAVIKLVDASTSFMTASC